MVGIFFRRKLYFFILSYVGVIWGEVDRGGVVFSFLFARIPDAVAVGDVVTNLDIAFLTVDFLLFLCKNRARVFLEKMAINWCN